VLLTKWRSGQGRSNKAKPERRARAENENKKERKKERKEKRREEKIEVVNGGAEEEA
jgi:hypothetical protein